ncbi:urease accessory protein, partial [Phenoliferia sp. Uapishka_3]
MDGALGQEEFLLLLLSDSNLPTGGFVSSSGLESHIQHGLLQSPPKDGLVDFIRASLDSYAKLQVPFMAEVHRLVESLREASLTSGEKGKGTELERDDAVLGRVVELDNELSAMMLNHVARRASTAQGVALLTLYQRSFDIESEVGVGKLVARLRAGIRAGECSGYQTVGFAVLAAGLGVTLASSTNLFLFLHARSLLSSAVRLNAVGPYVSHRLLLHDVGPMVEEAVLFYEGTKNKGGRWDEEGDEDGPATTWPLGEILGTRHELLHSKIFNS